MRILITGGAGFIGSNLADRLLARGDEVLVIDNYATGRRDNLTDHDALTVVEETIADADAVVDVAREADVGVGATKPLGLAQRDV